MVDDGLGDLGLEVVSRALAVGLADAGVELVREAADGELVAVIGGAEAAGSHAAEVLAGLDDGDGFAESGGFDRGGDAAGSAAVDDDVVVICENLFGKRRKYDDRHKAQVLVGIRSTVASPQFSVNARLRIVICLDCIRASISGRINRSGTSTRAAS